ncbi:hypothetical protein SDC9_103766 [bioreactor metagenome]|uniref:Uncharacterized protein n=1 Tax=bioreactor metagenome TaxID=1076179 RepID=A0A645AV30_9ZZZZ
MVLRGDFDFAGQQVLDRVVAAVVPELQPSALRAGGDSEQLVAEADAEQRNLADQFADVFNRVAHGGGVGGAVRQEQHLRLQRQRVFGGRGRREDGDAHVVRRQPAQDVVLDSEVEGDHVELAFFVPFVTFARGDFRGVVLPVQPFPDAGAFDRFRFGERGAVHMEPRFLAAFGAQHHGEAAGVHSGDAGAAVPFEVVGKRLRRLVVGGGVQFMDDQSVQKQSAGFDILRIASVISDFRRSEGDELPGVGRIGHNLLIAGHSGVEYRFADRIPGSAEAPAPEDGAVGQRQEGGPLAPLFPVIHIAAPYEYAFNIPFRTGLFNMPFRRYFPYN